MEATRKKEEQEMVGKIQMEAERKIAKLNKHMKQQIKEGLPTDRLGTKGESEQLSIIKIPKSASQIPCPAKELICTKPI